MARHRPPRPYGQLIQSLRLAWRIKHLSDEEAIWTVGAADQSELPANFRVSAWNICKGAGGRLFEHDFRVLAYHSDLILLQEALMSRRALKTFCEPGFGLLHAGSYQRRDMIRDGVATISRSRFEDPCLRIPCRYPEPFFKTPKVALVTFHKVQGQTQRLMVINLHSTLVRGVKRAREEMQHLFDQLPEHQGPAVLCGDFNTFTPRLFDRIYQLIEAQGFQFARIQEDPRKGFSLLDHAFVRKLKVEKSEVLETIRSSDHFPLLFHLRFH